LLSLLPGRITATSTPSRSTSTIAATTPARGITVRCEGTSVQRCPPRRRPKRRRRSDGRDRVPLRGPVARLPRRQREPPRHLVAQVLRLNDRIHHELRRQVEDVDLLRVLGAQL